METDVKITFSNGYTRSGERIAFVRPARECFNKSRKVKASKVVEIIKKYYTPTLYYFINGYVIGSNNPVNALKEYYKVCEKTSTPPEVIPTKL